MTKEEELDWLCRLRSEIYVYMPKEWLIPMNNALDMAISALSENKGDLISRQAVENITWEEPSYSDPLNVLTEVREKVRALPSVENKGEFDGMTNGEVLISFYPNLKYTIQNGRVVTTIGVASSFDLDWWNAPYKTERVAESENKE